MTDQYYEQEDNVTETPETALANFQAQSNAMAHFVPETAQDLERSHQLLGKIWQDAGAQGNVGIQAMVDHLWDIEQRQSSKVVQLDAARQDAARQDAIAALQHIDEKYTQAESELSQTKAAIQEAIEDGGTDNPLIGELIYSIRESSEDEYMGGLYMECPGCEAANLWYDTPLQHDAVNDLCLALFSANSDDIPPPLREELAVFINGWVAKWDAHIDTLREQARARMAAEDEAAE